MKLIFTVKVYRVCQKNNPLKTSACRHPLQMKIYPVVCLCTKFGPLISMFVRTTTIFIAVLLNFISSLQFSAVFTDFFRNKLITLMKSYGKMCLSVTVTSVIIFYIQYAHVSWHTSFQLLGKVLHTFNNGFLQQGSSDLLQCILQLGNCSFFLSIAWCLRLLQAAKMWVNLMTQPWRNFCEDANLHF